MTRATHAVVLDGHVQSALALVRSLGRAGVRVVVGGVDPRGMANASRFAAETFVYPDPELDPTGFVASVAAQARGGVVFFCSDATALPITRRREELGAVVLAPVQDRVEAAFDKRRTLQLAASLGVVIPPTAFLTRADELEGALDRLGTPVVVKPPHSCTWPPGGGPAVTGTASFCADAASARRKVDELLSATGEMPLVQGLIHGPEVGFFGLFEGGEPRMTFGHRRLRSIRTSGGASALRESVEPHPDVARWSLALMRALDWTGVAMVEFKFDERTGVPNLMEVNGRFWGSLPLAVAAGADFPLAAWQLASTGSVGGFAPPKLGVRSRNLVGDLRHLVGTLRGPGPGRGAAIREFVRWGDPDTHWDVMAVDDPWPFFAQFVEKGARVVRRNLKAARS